MKIGKCLFWIPVVVFLSCQSSDENVDPINEESFPVKFSLSLKEEVLPFHSTRSIPPLNIAEPVAETKGDDEDTFLEDLCCKIEYIVYKSGEDKPYKRRTQDSNDLDFGIISDQLPRGEYQIVLVAHNSLTTEVKDKYMLFDRVTDTFYYSLDLSIVPGDNNDRSLTLYRTVSKIEFVSTDIVPENAKELTIQLDQYPNTLDLETGYGITPDDTPALLTYPLSAHIGETDLTHAFFTFVPVENIFLDAQLEAIGSDDEVLRTRHIDDIKPIINNIIRYSGRLYNSSHSDDEFTVTIEENGEWGNTIEEDIGD